MPRSTGRAHVVRVKKTHADKQGRERVYESVLLRRTYRNGPKVRNETVANLSMLSTSPSAKWRGVCDTFGDLVCDPFTHAPNRFHAIMGQTDQRTVIKGVSECH